MASSARIDELRKKFDENPRRYFAPLANEYRKAGDLGQAIFICQEYLPQQPGHMSGHIVYGQALYESGRREEAQVVFETALSLDPENLIALRHLGDIARQKNDANAARIWYQRVLEADPRNEEIAQIMISLLSTPEPVAAPAPTAAQPSVNGTTPTPLSTPTVPGPPSWAAPQANFGAPDDSLDIEKSQEARFREMTPPVSHPAVSQPAADGFERETHALLDLDDFSIGGSSATEREGTAPAAMGNAQESAAASTAAPDADAAASGQRTDTGHVTAAFPEASEPQGSSAPTESTEGSRSELPSSTDAFELVPTTLQSESAEILPATALDVPVFEVTARFVADPLAVAAVPPLSTVEIGSGIEHDPPPPRASRMLEVVGQPTKPVEEPSPPPAETPDRVGPVDLASTFEFIAFTPPHAQEATPQADGTPAGAATGVAETNGEMDGEASGEPAAAAMAPEAQAGLGTRDASKAPEAVDHVEPAVLQAPDAPQEAGHAAAQSDADRSLAESISTEMPAEVSAERPALDSQFAQAELVASPASSELDEAMTDSASELMAASYSVDGPDDAPAVAAVAPHEAFVTETMAELYLQQGHLEQALEIYNRLVQQRPDDLELRRRLRVVENRVHGIPEPEPEVAQAVSETPPVVPVYGGPTIREFLRGLAAARPGMQHAEYHAESQDHQDVFEEQGTALDPALDPMFDSAFDSSSDVQQPLYNPTAMPGFDGAYDEIPRTTQAYRAHFSTDDHALLGQAEALPEPHAPESVGEAPDESPYDAPTPEFVASDADFGDTSVSVSSEEVETRRDPLAAPHDDDLDPAFSTMRTTDERIRDSFDALFMASNAESEEATADAVPPDALNGPESVASTDVVEHMAQPEDPESATALPDMPARPAASELSLDHVFKGASANRAEGSSGFSFDRFFANDAAATQSKAPGDGRAPAMGAEDIAQFNAWLNGLKKT